MWILLIVFRYFDLLWGVIDHNMAEVDDFDKTCIINGYKFNTKAKETIFNPNMLLYFIKELEHLKAYVIVSNGFEVEAVVVE